MALTFDNRIQRKNPIKRNTKFFSEEDINLEKEFALECITEDFNQTVILYQVDLEKTQVNDIYKEAKKDAIRFLPPVEIPVVYEVSDAQIRAYDNRNSKGIYAKVGKLTFSVLISTLEEMDCDIKRGDYIGVQITPEYREYWTVVDDGRVNMTSNRQTIYGTQPWYRRIECAPIDMNEFNG